MREQTTRPPSSSGIGFVGLLTILFIGLKLTGFIDWSWWWVLSPIWISIIIIVAIVIVAVIIFGLIRLFYSKRMGK